MTGIRRFFAASASTILLNALGVGYSAGLAGAATVGCQGWLCAGLDPAVTVGCSVTSTTTTNAVYKGTSVVTLWNRYSSNCIANWARAQLTSAGRSGGDSIQLEIETTDSQGTDEFMCYPGNTSNQWTLNEGCNGYTYSGSLAAYTDMVDGTNITTVTVIVYDANGNQITTASVNQ